MKITNFSFTNC